MRWMKFSQSGLALDSVGSTSRFSLSDGENRRRGYVRPELGHDGVGSAQESQSEYHSGSQSERRSHHEPLE